jgi:hypothetical protein
LKGSYVIPSGKLSSDAAIACGSTIDDGSGLFPLWAGVGDGRKGSGSGTLDDEVGGGEGMSDDEGFDGLGVGVVDVAGAGFMIVEDAANGAGLAGGAGFVNAPFDGVGPDLAVVGTMGVDWATVAGINVHCNVSSSLGDEYHFGLDDAFLDKIYEVSQLSRIARE